MNYSSSREIYWLALTCAMTGLMWLPYIINRLREQGFAQALYDPDGHTATRVNWAERMMRAHANAVENLAVFAPLTISVVLLGAGNATTALACEAYFIARLVHYVVFTLGLPYVRIIAFTAGVIAMLVLFVELLRAMTPGF